MSFIWQSINCKCQYVGSATSFKQHFCIHKSDIKTKKDHCGTARHYNSIWCHPNNPHGYLKVQLIEQVFCDASKNIESILWEGEKQWQCQLFTNIYGMNSILIYIVEIKNVAEKSHLFVTSLYFNYLRIHLYPLSDQSQSNVQGGVLV